MDNHHKQQLHFFFLPMPAPGHIIPMVSFARLLAKRGVRSTVVVTPGNVRYVNKSDDDSIEILTIPFPDVGLPEGCESTADLNYGADDGLRMSRAMALFQLPFEDLLRGHSPDCVVSDWAFVWPPTSALSLGQIPHVTFRGSCAFTACVMEHAFYGNITAGASGPPSSLVGLPHRVLDLEERELPMFHRLWVERFCMPAEKAEKSSVGVVIDTFREIEGEYVELLEKNRRRIMWCPGPLHLIKEKNSDDWGSLSQGSSNRIKKWLDSKDPESVLYVCFGSEWRFGQDQLREIASGLESAGTGFIWVVRSEGAGVKEWLPEGFEEKVGERGLVITEWAPQVPILNHPSVGGFLSHVGWNSALEAVGAGKPMILWPLHSDQFFNERLFVDVLGVGIRVLEEGDMRIMDPDKKKLVTREKVKEVTMRLFGTGTKEEEAKEMRRKAKEYGKLARLAIEEGGSSYNDITCLINKITLLAQAKRQSNPK